MISFGQTKSVIKGFEILEKKLSQIECIFFKWPKFDKNLKTRKNISILYTLFKQVAKHI